MKIILCKKKGDAKIIDKKVILNKVKQMVKHVKFNGQIKSRLVRDQQVDTGHWFVT